MLKLFRHILAAALCVAGVLSPGARTNAAAPHAVTTVADGMNRLGFDLLGRLTTADQSGNVFISPVSIDECVALLYNGARGQTANHCSSFLGLSTLSMPDADQGFLDLNTSLHSADPAVRFDVANAIWADIHEHANGDYAQRCGQCLGARVRVLDFGKPDDAAAAINGWVDKHTEHKIPTIVGPTDVDGASAVLTNAVYFHGKWTEPFDKRLTRLEPFHSGGGDIQVSMMYADRSFDYFADDRMQAVSLPYGSGRLRMLVAVDKGDAAPAPSLTSESFHDLVSRLKPREVALALPRLSIKYENHGLAPVLHAMGLPLTGDYSGMGINASVDTIIHKATLDVDEEGTVASAATAIILKATAVRKVDTMRIDHPFFCAIYDSQTGAVLFAGVVRNPSAS